MLCTFNLRFTGTDKLLKVAQKVKHYSIIRDLQSALSRAPTDPFPFGILVSVITADSRITNIQGIETKIEALVCERINVNCNKKETSYCLRW